MEEEIYHSFVNALLGLRSIHSLQISFVGVDQAGGAEEKGVDGSAAVVDLVAAAAVGSLTLA